MGMWIKKQTKKKRDDGKWEITVEICNQTTTDKGRMLVSEHPWAKADETRSKIGEEPEGKFISIKAGECKTVTFGPYDREPVAAYTDVYEKVDSNYKWVDGDAETPLSFIFIPRREAGRTALAFVLPLPYPWRAALAIGSPQEFVLKSITGLPPDWRITTRPAAGQPFVMSPDEKHHPVCIELESGSEVPEGLSFMLGLEFQMVGFPEEPFYRVRLEANLVRDTQGPQIRIERIASNGSEEVTLHASDGASGLHRPMVRTSENDSWVMHLMQIVSEEFRASFAIAGRYRARLGNGRHVISVADGVGNVSEVQIHVGPSAPEFVPSDLPISAEMLERRFRIVE